LFSLFFTEIVERPFYTHRAIMGPVYGLPNASNPVEVEADAGYVEWLKDYVPPDQDPGEPSGEIYYPIFDAVENSLHENETHNLNGTETQVVGLLWLGFFWRDAFTDLLPQGSRGIDLVLSNPCTMACTYRLDGQNATFVGAGDLHEPQYTQYGVNSTLLGLRKFAVSKSSYTGVPFDEEFCPILLTVYPSSATQAQYTTTNRIVFTVCSVLIFGFTSIVFVLYDKSVERRQNKVMKTAVRAETIVQSLFPAVVRDRLYPTDTDNAGSGAKAGGGFRVANSKSRIQSFLGSDREDTHNEATEVGDMSASPPVADLFPECTVMFTDIVGTFVLGQVVISPCRSLLRHSGTGSNHLLLFLGTGFTSWSSVREPAQVFTLLETIYGAFDAVARRRGVYKVETIGDSYVAVAGLPVPREDHAVVMARFARDCRDKMAEVTRRLETTLGPDTSDLKVRYLCLHSASTSRSCSSRTSQYFDRSCSFGSD
jgi:Adenylate and Guanylate cyclase catalytic domain